jgi:predicted anti-sigma-YlaC factor YlaD
MAPDDPRCENARGWVSLRLDDDLSEFEIFLLDAHLRRCAACREFALDTSAFTSVLRSRPLEERAQPVVSVPLPQPQPWRRQRLLFSQVASAVALVAVMGGAVDLILPRGSGGDAPQIDARQASGGATQDDLVGTVAARRAHLLAATSRWWIPRRGFQLT